MICLILKADNFASRSDIALTSHVCHVLLQRKAGGSRISNMTLPTILWRQKQKQKASNTRCKYSYSSNKFHQKISTNNCPPKVYLPTLMIMMCVRKESTGHIPCVYYSRVEPIPLRPLLFSDYHQHHPILSSYQSQFIQSSHISFQFLPAGNIKIKLDWKYHHSKCLAILPLGTFLFGHLGLLDSLSFENSFF